MTRIYRLWLWLKDRQNRLWVTPLLTGLAAVALAFGADAVGMLLDDNVPEIKAQTIDDLLTVIATSMLALAIFSLATLVAALNSSSMTATPRSTELLMGDSAARASIGSFIAAFIFAIVARTALGTGYYGTGGRFVLFVSTLLVVAFVVLRLMLWIRSASRLGRLADTLERLTEVTGQALLNLARRPRMGAGALESAPVDHCTTLQANECGYLTDINMSGLQDLADRHDLRIHVQIRPGTFIDPSTLLARIEGKFSADSRDELLDCFVLAAQRTYDQDPRFGLIVLGEIALRALSPAVNDPGTAIQVMSALTSLLVDYTAHAHQQLEPEFDRLTAPVLDDRDLVRDAFQPIGRDGAAIIEVAVRMQKLLAVVAQNSSGVIAAEALLQAREARERALQVLSYAPDRDQLDALHRQLFP
ncbi:MAG TPA: DUF2254 domain-containing protein [Steroidobacteraceae bacterium]|nr:DUF2254 domain-containing protein [Steroidobacteraceae bacterium]